MKNNYITEISFEDFSKLNLKGYKREWKEYQNYRKLVWVEYDLTKEVQENFDYSKKIGEDGNVVVAIHKNWEKAKTGAYDIESDFYYYDKWLNHLGASTYQLGGGISKLYKGTNKWYIKEDYFEIPYDETEKIYLIHKKS